MSTINTLSKIEKRANEQPPYGPSTMGMGISVPIFLKFGDGEYWVANTIADVL